MERALAQLVDALERAPETFVRAIDVLPPSERDRAVIEWNRTEAPYPSERCIHELFEKQVEKTPDAPAVVYEGESLSYAELNERANRLAHYLRDKGVRPDARVGLCVERGVPMVVVARHLEGGWGVRAARPELPAAAVELLTLRQ
jgi:non-ribosomal peptide synthetase component F